VKLTNKIDLNDKIKRLNLKESEILEFVENEKEFFVSSET